MAPQGYPHVRAYTPLRARSSSPTCAMHSAGKKFFTGLFWSGGGSSEPPEHPLAIRACNLILINFLHRIIMLPGPGPVYTVYGS